MPVSVEVRQILYEVHLLKIIRKSKFNAVAALRAWRTMAAIDWEESDKTYYIPFGYFGSTGFVGFHLDRDLPLGQNMCPARSDIGKEVFD